MKDRKKDLMGCSHPVLAQEAATQPQYFTCMNSHT